MEMPRTPMRRHGRGGCQCGPRRVGPGHSGAETRKEEGAADRLERWKLHQRDLEQELADVVEHIRRLEGNIGPAGTQGASASD